MRIGQIKTRYMFAAGVVTGLALVGGLAACDDQGNLMGSEQQSRDLKGIPAEDPDEAVLINNVDGYPNIVRICKDGVAFATTQRDYAPVFMVPDWNDECGGKEGGA